MDCISGNDGDLDAIAHDCDCTLQSVRTWIALYELNQFVVDCRGDMDKLAKAVAREKLRGTRSWKLAMRWLDRSDRLKERAGMTIDYDVQTAFDMDSITQAELDTLEGKHSE